jgi:TonB family protein
MPSAKETRLGGRLRGHIGRSALLSLLLHAQIFVPLLIFVFIHAAREEAQRAEEVDVAFRDVSNEELPPDLPSLEEPPPPLKAAAEPPEPEQPDQKKHKEKEKPKPQLKPQPQPADKKPLAEQPKPKSKPEPEVPIPPMPPMPKEEPPPPIPKPEPRAHEKMVDLDNDKEVEPPPDAKYLAQKNNRTEVETRATDTNLDKAQKGGEQSSPSERQDEKVGDDKAKIAQLADEKSALGRKAPEVTPHINPELSEEQPTPTPKSLLALRDAARREHEITPETVDPSLPHAPDGNIAIPDQGLRGPRADAARLSKGKRMKLALSAHDYEYLFGADAEAERRLAQTERSKKVGRFQKRQDRMKSALENFIPEVKPGNQESLNTRAAPFAAFVARMHRSIHQLWGFGQLEEWDEKSGSNPFNNRNLLTTLELVLNGDGTVDKVTMVKSSGYLPYDVAAIDIVYSAGPYPDPPRAIRSKNGKIYIHWRFYRDERQCATSGVDYFILDNAPADGDKAPAVPDGVNGVLQPRSAKPPAAGGPPSAAAGGATEAAPRHLQSAAGDSPAHRAQQRLLEQQVAAAGEGGGESEGASPSTAASAGATAAPQPVPAAAPPRPTDPAAQALAHAWFDAFAHGDVLTLLGKAIYPFRSNSSRTAAGSRGELATMLKALVDETPASSRAVTGMQLYSAAALRAMIGHLPPGMDESTSMLFALARTEGKDTLILMLERKGDGWKAAGLARR